MSGEFLDLSIDDCIHEKLVLEGVIVHYSHKDQFGFIEHPLASDLPGQSKSGRPPAFYFHRSEILDVRDLGDPMRGQIVEFELKRHKKRVCAAAIERVWDEEDGGGHRLEDAEDHSPPSPAAAAASAKKPNHPHHPQSQQPHPQQHNHNNQQQHQKPRKRKQRQKKNSPSKQQQSSQKKPKGVKAFEGVVTQVEPAEKNGAVVGSVLIDDRIIQFVVSKPNIIARLRVNCTVSCRVDEMEGPFGVPREVASILDVLSAPIPTDVIDVHVGAKVFPLYGRIIEMEDNKTEFKEGKNASAWLSTSSESPTGLHKIRQYVCAFLNSFDERPIPGAEGDDASHETFGGSIYLGVKDDGTIVGAELNRKDVDRIKLMIDSLRMNSFTKEVNIPVNFIQYRFIPVIEDEYEYANPPPRKQYTITNHNRFVLALDIKSAWVNRLHYAIEVTEVAHGGVFERGLASRTKLSVEGIMQRKKKFEQMYGNVSVADTPALSTKTSTEPSHSSPAAAAQKRSPAAPSSSSSSASANAAEQIYHFMSILEKMPESDWNLNEEVLQKAKQKSFMLNWPDEQHGHGFPHECHNFWQNFQEDCEIIHENSLRSLGVARKEMEAFEEWLVELVQSPQQRPFIKQAQRLILEDRFIEALSSFQVFVDLMKSLRSTPAPLKDPLSSESLLQWNRTHSQPLATNAANSSSSSSSSVTAPSAPRVKVSQERQRDDDYNDEDFQYSFSSSSDADDY